MIQVTVHKNGETRICQAVPNPGRYKCGHCGRGNVVWFDHRVSVTMVKACKVCGAKVEVIVVQDERVIGDTKRWTKVLWALEQAEKD